MFLKRRYTTVTSYSGHFPRGRAGQRRVDLRISPFNAFVIVQFPLRGGYMTLIQIQNDCLRESLLRLEKIPNNPQISGIYALSLIPPPKIRI